MFGSNLTPAALSAGAKGLSLSKILSGAGKTLTFVNKAIPMYYQIKPMLGNARTLINMYGAMKDSPSKKQEPKQIEQKKEVKAPTTKTTSYKNDTLTFFL